VTLLRRHVQTNAAAASYWLRRVLDDDRRCRCKETSKKKKKQKRKHVKTWKNKKKRLEHDKNAMHGGALWTDI